MDTTVLKISNATNTLFDDYQIGNLLNKNLLIRNIALMRNIGKYSMYNQILFPEIGMQYNVYERLLNRPEDIGAINGIIGYNHAITDDTVLSNKGNSAADRFFNQPYTIPSDTSKRKRKKGESKESDDKADANSTNELPRRIIYVTNSNSVERSGGEVALGEVMKSVNEIFKPENQYVPEDLFTFSSGIGSFDGMSVNRPLVMPYGVKTWGHTKWYSRDTDDRYVKTYSEGTMIDLNSIGKSENQNIPEHLTVDYMTEEFDYSANNSRPGTLLQKTNKLFHEGKIGSLISRFYATESPDDVDPEFYGTGNYLSRGRNLHKAGGLGVNRGGGYDNPYCRVWTIHNQYNRMTDLIRPRLDDETGGFASIQRIQAPYGQGYRPANGASRLSDMSVLKPNGFVNFAPHQDENGKLDIESIKRCMFSIENLAWRDVKIKSSTTRGYYTYAQDGTRTYVTEDEETIKGATLSPEQIGPNGGRIMWFPPYNLKFSEDVTTRWNSNTFIGRGEDIYSYINTERGGTLSFTILIDHPSIINKWKGANPDTNDQANEEKILRFFAGCDELGMEEMANQARNDLGEQKKEPETMDVNPKETNELAEIKAFVFFPNNYSGVDDSSDEFANYLHNANSGDGKSTSPYEMTGSISRLNAPIDGPGQIWYYKVDDCLVHEKLVRFEKGGQYYIRTESGGVKPQTGEQLGNNHDTKSFRLNSFNESTLNTNNVADRMTAEGFIDSNDEYGRTFFSFGDLYDVLAKGSKAHGPLSHILNTEEIENIDHIEFRGYASSHGHVESNNSLCRRRADSVMKWLQNKKPSIDAKKMVVTTAKVVKLDATNKDVSSLDAKLARSVEVIFYVSQKNDVVGNHKDNSSSAATWNRANTRATHTDPQAQQKQLEKLNADRRALYQTTTILGDERNIYDNEYTYFKELYESDSFIKSRIIEKINYFDPAYHSITPEGFNARLTFLHQCTRQGPTAAASDANAKTKDTGVGNLAFGRAPYCVLRIGDFYNTKILIDSMSINYDVGNGIQWDLNPEGVGVQPMMAEIQIRFKFVGGTDISGPIERLQNAVSFNYYSNASIYDRRADYRQAFIDHEITGNAGVTNPVYHFDAKTQGRKSDKNE